MTTRQRRVTLALKWHHLDNLSVEEIQERFEQEGIGSYVQSTIRDYLNDDPSLDRSRRHRAHGADEAVRCVMSTKNTSSTVPESVTRQNCRIDHYLRERWPPMNLKTWKVLKNLVISVAIVGFGVIAIDEGANPMHVFSLGIIVLGLVNGMELGEFYAAWADVQSTNENNSTSSDDDSGS